MPRRTAFRLTSWLSALVTTMCLLSGVPRAQAADPYGDCCLSQVTMQTFNTWTVVCGDCSANPGTYLLRQPDPTKLAFVGPTGETAGSRYEAAAAICHCPSQRARRAREKSMRVFDGR